MELSLITKYPNTPLSPSMISGIILAMQSEIIHLAMNAKLGQVQIIGASLYVLQVEIKTANSRKIIYDEMDKGKKKKKV